MCRVCATPEPMSTGKIDRLIQMKIVHVIVGLEVGGAELMLKRLLLANKNKDIEQTVISLTQVGKVGKMLGDAGIEVIALEMRSARDFPRTLVKLTGVLKRSGADVVQTWMYHADLLGGMAARLAGKRNVIWGIRGTVTQQPQKSSTRIVLQLCAAMSRRLPTVIVCCAESARLSHSKLGYDSSKMVVIANGYDFAQFDIAPSERATMRAQIGLADTDVVIGIVGRFHPLKDHENFVRAAGLVAARHPNAKFLMVGRDLRESNKLLMGWLHATGFGERFILLGERSDVPACLSAMDIFGLSSQSEGFPNVVAEAMFMERPCVVTDAGDAAVVVGDKGIVVPVRDAAALAAGFELLLAKSPLERHELGVQARERIRSEYAIERTRARFDALYNELIKQRAT